MCSRMLSGSDASEDPFLLSSETRVDANPDRADWVDRVFLNSALSSSHPWKSPGESSVEGGALLHAHQNPHTRSTKLFIMNDGPSEMGEFGLLRIILGNLHDVSRARGCIWRPGQGAAGGPGSVPLAWELSALKWTGGTCLASAFLSLFSS